MKRIVAVILAVLLLVFSAGAFADTNTAETLKGEGWEITDEYAWSTGRYNKYAFVLLNTSGYNARISINAIFYDKDDSIVGVASSSENACENGYSTYWEFSNDVEFKRVSLRISMEKEEWYKDGGQSAIKLTVSKVNEQKIILIAENVGKEAVEFVEYNVLYLKDGRVVSTDWGYLTDKDSEIKPGAMEMAEEKCSEDFTEVKVYAHGRIDK